MRILMSITLTYFDIILIIMSGYPLIILLLILPSFTHPVEKHLDFPEYCLYHGYPT